MSHTRAIHRTIPAFGGRPHRVDVLLVGRAPEAVAIAEAGHPLMFQPEDAVLADGIELAAHFHLVADEHLGRAGLAVGGAGVDQLPLALQLELIFKLPMIARQELVPQAGGQAVGVGAGLGSGAEFGKGILGRHVGGLHLRLLCWWTPWY